MKKIILFILLIGSFLYAGLVDGIALIVNKEVITLYDIHQRMQQKNISKEEAVSQMIDKIIYDQELKRYNINISILDIDNYIEKLASVNNMNLLDFKLLIRQKEDYNQFIKKIKQLLTHQALIYEISQGNIKPVSDADMKIYYDNHTNEFSNASTVDIIAYVSKNKNQLEMIKQNPMMNNQNILTKELSFKLDEVNPQAKYILNNTSVNNFSAIFSQNKVYNMFFKKDKKDIKIEPFMQLKTYMAFAKNKRGEQLVKLWDENMKKLHQNGKLKQIYDKADFINFYPFKEK